MRDAYRLVWTVLTLVGQRWIAWGGGIALLVLYGLAYGNAVNGLPYVVVWALFVGACRMLQRVLPMPGKQSAALTKTPPPATIAVGVAPPTSPPRNLEQMTAALSPRLQAILRQPDETHPQTPQPLPSIADEGRG